MKVLEKLCARARSFPQHIVLFEGEEDRALEAARLIEKDKLARLTLLGDVEQDPFPSASPGNQAGNISASRPRIQPQTGEICRPRFTSAAGPRA